MTVLQVEPAAPAQAVGLIDTDIQVEIAPSRAEEDELLRQEREAAMAQERDQMMADAAARTAQALQQRQEAARARVVAEPAATQEGVITVAIRLPDGTRLLRRILKTAPLQELLDFLDADGLAGVPLYCLCTTFPRRVMRREEAHAMLEELGLSLPQESLVVEVMSSPSR
jgi:hypothetical protein